MKFGKLKHKFGAIPCKKNGIKFPSKLEGKYYEKLKILQSAGEIIMFLRQPLFDLPGGATYKADFIEFWADGTVRIVDVKGMETQEFILKKKIVESIYPVEIKVVKNI